MIYLERKMRESWSGPDLVEERNSGKRGGTLSLILVE